MAVFARRVILGRTGLSASSMGLGSSYGLNDRDVAHAFDRGINYFYWGSARRASFGRGVKELAARQREQLILVVQSYTRAAFALRPSLERALKRLGTDYADLLLLGWWNQMPPRRILDAAMALKDAGRARHIMISCHHRPSFAALAAQPEVGAIMVRYNAAHPRAESEVFPHLGAPPPGVVAYTATRWGTLLRRDMVPASEPVPRASDCYRFALSNPSVNIVLAGPANRAELDEALAALERGPLSADEMAWMRRVGAAVRIAGRKRRWLQPIDLLDRLARVSGP